MDQAADKVSLMNSKSSDTNSMGAEKEKVDKRLSNLDDIQLKDLLEEAITYKNPSDRKGKSDIFVQLLDEAEESERIAAASRAGGCELVRHCNPTAKRNHRNRRKQSSSVSENVMHGGSLDNLSNEEFYDNSSQLNKTRKTVSTRQREGGSLPCKINKSIMPNCDQFLEEARRKKTNKEYRINKNHTIINDNYNYEEAQVADHILLQEIGKQSSADGCFDEKFVRSTITTPSSNKEIVPLMHESGEVSTEKKIFDTETLLLRTVPSKCNISIYSSKILFEDKKVDENGNIHHSSGNKIKKKKVQSDKNVKTVINAESVEGHRSDIIHDIPKLIQYIGGNNSNTSKNKSNFNKAKQANKSDTEDGAVKKRQRINSSKTKESNRNTLKKCNSLGEMSTKGTEENLSVFTAQDSSGKFKTDEDIDIQANKSKEKLVERRSWGHIETSSLYTTASSENLESIESWTISKPKKKGKKRRNSLSSSSVYNQSNTPKNLGNTQNRAPSPDLYSNKCSIVFQSDKSVDSESDAESIHSLPICGVARPPISYADVAKNDKIDDRHQNAANHVQSSEAPSNVCVNNNNNNVIEPSLDSNHKKLNSDVKEKRFYRTESSERNACPQMKNAVAINHNNNSQIGISDIDIEKHNKKISNTKQINTESEHLVKENCMENVHRKLDNPNNKNSTVLESNSACHKKPASGRQEKDGSSNTTNIPRQQQSIIVKESPKTPLIIEKKTAPCGNNQTSKEVTKPIINCDLNENKSSKMKLVHNNVGEAVNKEDPPPVVILSGAYNKEVPDLTFGFDINEQLLNEDLTPTKLTSTSTNNNNNNNTNNVAVNKNTCVDEQFTNNINNTTDFCQIFMRYMDPKMTNISHNHEKIVQYIETAWKQVIKQCNNGVQYYSMDL